ncbi:MAG: hypothetical protein M3394_09880, partial [Actinomycetota bacterium]|nr:hypothetical protein [Actinomycetota bacterium]
RTAGFVTIGCQSGNEAAQVARVHLDDSGRPKCNPTCVVDLRPLPRVYGDTLADQAGGRLYFRSVYDGTSWWVYDAHEDSWVGAAGAALSDSGLQIAAGIDPSTGRFYNLVPDHTYFEPGTGDIRVPGGFRYTDGRLSPVPQFAHALPELAYPGLARILVDPEATGRPRRLFLRQGSYGATCFPNGSVAGEPCQPLVHPFWLVIEDRVPVAEQPSVEEVDRYTTDVSEEQNVTGANFDGTGNGFGMRVLLTGGLSAATTRALDPKQTAEHGSPCPMPDREAVFGHVKTARVSNISAAAQASGITLDQRTHLDLADPAHRCWPNPAFGILVRNVVPGDANKDVPAQGAEVAEGARGCSGNGRDAGSSDGAVQRASSVECDQAKGEVRASAGAQLELEDLTVSSATTDVSVKRDGTGGVVATVRSRAEGVSLGAIGTIGRITTEAVTRAAGRPGTAAGEFRRTICGVSVGTLEVSGCLTDAQQQQLVTSINQRMYGRGEARLREPDDSFRRGTPGGYQAAVQRDLNEQFGDVYVNRDMSQAVPGLELIFYRDDGRMGAGRQTVQFAGVEASSQYGIYCLNGLGAGGRCNAAALPSSFGDDRGPEDGAALFAAATLNERVEPNASLVEPAAAAVAVEKAPGSPVRRFFGRVVEALKEVAGLLFSDPGELMLMAGVWFLIWAPCYLGERRWLARAATAPELPGATA